MERCYVPYDEAKSLIKEGDILLFRRPSSFWSSLIRASGETPYSHCGLVSFSYDNVCDLKKEISDPAIEVVEMKEIVGCRAVSLQWYLNHYRGEIDVFSPNSSYTRLYFDCEKRKIMQKHTTFNGRRITNEMRNMGGEPYSWWKIFRLALRSLFIVRYFFDSPDIMEDRVKGLDGPVCSSAVAYCYSKHFADLTHFRNDNYMLPSDVVKSNLTHYILTITK